MDHFLLIVILFIFFILTNAQNGSNTSITNRSWFWPVIGISLAFLFSISSTLIILVLVYYNKYKFNDDSNIRSNSPVPERRHRHSRHIEGFRSPPPPYTTCDRPKHLFMTSSHPPSYEFYDNEIPSTIVNVPSTENLNNPRALNVSSTSTSPSIQTFQA